ncbi:hypothetical protein L7F22_057692 [Adiantum nelumboides]|nr:hypothetical protein [Adiantum nelumboides]
MQLEVVTQERDNSNQENHSLIQDLMDAHGQLTRKEGQCHELIRKEKKMQEQLKYEKVERSTRASLGGILTHRYFEKKVKPQHEEVLPSREPVKLEEVHSLYFDGAYKRIIDKSAAGVVVFDEEGEKIFSTSELLKNSHSNNKAKYAALVLKEPLFQGSDCMQDIVDFPNSSECPGGLTKGQRQWLVCKATRGYYMTRWAEAATTTRITTKEVAKFVFENICCRFGTPPEIIFDRGPGFRGDLVGELMEQLGISRPHSSPYYPQCNGLVEKVNGMIYRIITKQANNRPKDWDLHLNAALWAYRTSFKTNLGYTLYQLVFGKKTILPIEVQLASL